MLTICLPVVKHFKFSYKTPSQGIWKWNKSNSLTFKQCISHTAFLTRHWTLKHLTYKRAVYINKTQFKCYWMCFDKTHDSVMASEQNADCFNLGNLNKWRMSCSNLPRGVVIRPPMSPHDEWEMALKCPLCAVSPQSPHLGFVGWPSPDQVPPNLPSPHNIIK